MGRGLALPIPFYVIGILFLLTDFFISALDIKDTETKGNEEEDGGLTPRHLHLAYSNLERAGKLFPVVPRKNPFL
jgi:hypothetical protein